MSLQRIWGLGQKIEPGHDPPNDEIRYWVVRNGRGFEVRISRSAVAEAYPSLEQRVQDWLDNHPLPEAGASIRIPDYHFRRHDR